MCRGTILDNIKLTREQVREVFVVTAEQVSNVWFNIFHRIVQIWFKFCTRFLPANVCKSVFGIFYTLLIIFYVVVEVPQDSWFQGKNRALPKFLYGILHYN